ncbi:unnamed protein product, partial [Polarella glacialis]
SLSPTSLVPGTKGKKCKLITNCFRMVWSPKASINHYHYKLSRPDVSPEEERQILQQVWKRLEEKLGVFVVRCPGHIFSPTELAEDVVLSTSGGAGGKLMGSYRIAPCDVSVMFCAKFSADQVNQGMMDEASVVAQHLVKKMAEPMRHQKVGRRYFNNCALEGKAQLTIISGFYVALNSLNKAGPMMQIDVMHRALHKRSIIESLQSSLECDPL